MAAERFSSESEQHDGSRPDDAATSTVAAEASVPQGGPDSPEDPTAANAIHQLPRRFYSGLWAILVRFFHVPRDAPSLPTRPGESVEAFKPAKGYLNRLRLEVAISLIVTAAFLVFGVVGISFASFEAEFGVVGFLLSSPIAIAIEVILAMIGLVTIHLRYDTMWYVMNDRSIRLRRGIWLIRETTITFENVQNVSVRQGPVQRLFGIANVLVETAGGGGSTDANQAGTAHHQGLIEGISDPHRIRDMIMMRLRKSKSAGLGDEGDEEPSTRAALGAWRPQHVRLLHEIHELLKTDQSTIA